MLKLPARLLVLSIVLHHLYIVFLNTSSLHGIIVPDKLVWTGVLTLFLVCLIYFYMSEPAKTWYEKSLYFAILLGLAGSVLRTFGFSSELISYSILILAMAILTTAPLVIHHHRQLNVMLLSIYTLEILIVIGRISHFNIVAQYVGPLVELAIVIGIIYYNYSLGFRYDELFIVILATFIGWQIGIFVADLNSKVPMLIISTMFEQMMSVGQFNLDILGLWDIGPKFFLSLHLAMFLNLVIVQILTRRSIRAAAVILAGIDMSYPPIMAFRAIAILAFLRGSMRDSPSPTSDETKHGSPSKEKGTEVKN